ncbi:ATP/GTP-binding protein [Gordonia jinhuaensis]|uniref:ATP/GTP-binding protein n=1 Tax=Gordonia jinhuaensis TaxID=1517702 RepID=UPI001667F155|nr:ATP/GTP-binding protein [Gordonia jinhuaensis]
MPRHNRREPDRRRETGDGGLGRVERGPRGDDVDYHVVTIPGSRAKKVYMCPGCSNTIAVGVAHVVAWPVDDFGGVDDRRHWHTGCWRGRRTRTGYR